MSAEVFNSLEIIGSERYQKILESARELARANGDKEVGFNAWFDAFGDLIINSPAVGDERSIYDHVQGFYEYDPGTGFIMGEGGELSVFTHTHPYEGEKDSFGIVAPSINDIVMLSRSAHENYQLAELFNRRSWVNPLGVIANTHNDDIAIYQVSSDVVGDSEFSLEDFKEECRLAVWGLFKHYYPHHARSKTGPVGETFSPMGIWYPRPWLPSFLYRPDRFQDYLKLIKVALSIGSLSTLTAEDKFEVNPITIPKQDFEFDDEEDEDDFVDHLVGTEEDEGFE